ncbi:MAG: Rv0340 family protein [Mycolicibacterium hassiacum]|jgi:hypothetical protein|uniref:Rv0340 family IniB-related protein n=1 Tax=Mycolicibacterium hassiacum TaxID=46351 RepID=UPI0023F76BE7|nr:Rv0340 family IniB-related protein [Mycolicibacterium hassiacum]MBX5489447.1 Rv0340 family protein [Mycolicibacterium hassiacum]
MANELLDFVMSLVRDPEAAARFAADPDQALVDANLTNVTVADVNNLIPVVADSLSVAASGGLPGADPGANVWASGAATAAFDAFDAELPVPGDDGGVIADVVQAAGTILDSATGESVGGPDTLVDTGVPDVVIDDPAVDDPVFGPSADDRVIEVADLGFDDPNDSGLDFI